MISFIAVESKPSVNSQLKTKNGVNLQLKGFFNPSLY